MKDDHDKTKTKTNYDYYGTPVPATHEFDETAQQTFTIKIQAHSCAELNDGVFEIVFKGKPIPKGYEDMIHSLFPHLEEHAHSVLERLLAKEALLSSVVEK